MTGPRTKITLPTDSATAMQTIGSTVAGMAGNSIVNRPAVTTQTDVMPPRATRLETPRRLRRSESTQIPGTRRIWHSAGSMTIQPMAACP